MFKTPNKGTFTVGCRYDKDIGLTKTTRYPGCSLDYVHDMLASQQGEK
jgi:hypothetical protein